jgi:activator of 2-hydroxyglutaryl-CoA dehydratase
LHGSCSWLKNWAQVLIPEKPQFIGALGAALLASEFESTAIE